MFAAPLQEQENSEFWHNHTMEHWVQDYGIQTADDHGYQCGKMFMVCGQQKNQAAKQYT